MINTGIWFYSLFLHIYTQVIWIKTKKYLFFHKKKETVLCFRGGEKNKYNNYKVIKQSLYIYIIEIRYRHIM